MIYDTITGENAIDIPMIVPIISGLLFFNVFIIKGLKC